MKDLTGFAIPDLEWIEIEPRYWAAIAGNNKYVIRIGTDGSYMYTMANGFYMPEGSYTLETAKVRCQEHYEALVLSLLKELPKPDDELTNEEKVLRYLNTNPNKRLPEINAGAGINSYNRLAALLNEMSKSGKILRTGKPYRYKYSSTPNPRLSLKEMLKPETGSKDIQNF